MNKYMVTWNGGCRFVEDYSKAVELTSSKRGKFHAWVRENVMDALNTRMVWRYFENPSACLE